MQALFLIVSIPRGVLNVFIGETYMDKMMNLLFLVSLIVRMKLKKILLYVANIIFLILDFQL